MTAPFLSVIVPAYNCAPVLRRCLAALAASTLPRSEWELIVADDGSTDDTVCSAAPVADRVVQVPEGPAGPGRARNEGACVATGEVLVFVDSDVCLAPTALEQFASLFREQPDLGAAFGAYDVAPDAQGFVSQYRNLLHHYVHFTSAGPAVTFWAGCGAVRREAFFAVGGYDAGRYRRPQIEDIELGYRLRAMGVPILLQPEIQGKHLKRWTFLGGLVTDFRDRGVPWMQLLLERRTLTVTGPLNLGAREKLFTVLTPLGLGTAVVALALRSPVLGAVAAAMILSVIAGNLQLLRWFAHMRGWRFAIANMPLRLTYYALNSLAAAYAIGSHVLHGHGAGIHGRAAPTSNGLVLTASLMSRAGYSTSRGPQPPAQPTPRETTRSDQYDRAEHAAGRMLVLAFAPIHKRAFGVAIGLALAAAVAVATILALVLDPVDHLGMGLLAVFFRGYSVTWRGVIIGAAWAAVGGFVAGWFVAFCRNLVLALWLLYIKARANLRQTRDFLDHI